jgi:Tol biopolymer transport system component
MSDKWKLELNKLKTSSPPEGLWERIERRQPAQFSPPRRGRVMVLAMSLMIALGGTLLAGIAFLQQRDPVRQGVSPVANPENGLIAYLSGPGPSRIVGVDPATGQRRDLTQPGPDAYDGDPAWSSDGARLAFVRTVPGLENENLSQSLLVLDSTTSSLAEVPTGDIAPLAPRWSPDGEWLAFEGTVSGGTGVYIVRPDGSGLAAMPSSTDHALAPEWAPDSTRLVYVDGNELVVSNIRTMTVEYRFPHDEITFDPNWSLDGLRLAYVTGRDIHVRSVSPAESTLTYELQMQSVAHLQWSPIDDSLLFAGLSQGDWDIYSLSLETGKVAPVTDQEGDESSPVWAPNGRWIAYLGSEQTGSDGDNTGTFDLFLISPAGERMKALTTSESAVGAGMDWQPIDKEGNS